MDCGLSYSISKHLEFHFFRLGDFSKPYPCADWRQNRRRRQNESAGHSPRPVACFSIYKSKLIQVSCHPARSMCVQPGRQPDPIWSFIHSPKRLERYELHPLHNDHGDGDGAISNPSTHPPALTPAPFAPMNRLPPSRANEHPLYV